MRQRAHQTALQKPIGSLSAIWRFFRDPNGSKLGKLFVLGTLVYVIMPIDFIPDLAPVIGWLDDLGLASLAIFYLTRVAKEYKAASMMPQPAPMPIIPPQPEIKIPEYDAYAP
jgi:uncharacterized membrane protein YkvA (DUF1232 family)